MKSVLLEKVFGVSWSLAVGIACCLLTTLLTLILVAIFCPSEEWVLREAYRASAACGIFMGVAQSLYASTYAVFGID